MQVGELFVNLGVKGSEKTVAAFVSLKTGLGDLRSMSLETKAAIIGALYAIEQMTASSNKLGSTFANASALLSMPTKTLQQYTNAAQLANASSQEMLATFGEIQSKLKAINLNEGTPKWMGRLSEITGFRFSGAAVEDFAKHPEKFLQLMQTYAQKEKDAPWRNEVLKQFVGSQNIQAALIRGAFNERSLNKIPLLSDSQVKNLDSNRQKFTELALKVERDFDKLNASKGITDFTQSLLNLVNALDKLETKLGILQQIGKVFSFVGSEMDIISYAARLLSGEKPESVRKDITPDSFWGKMLKINDGKYGAPQTVNPNVTINIDARGNQNAHEIARKVKTESAKVFDEMLNKKFNQAPRPNTGQTTGKPR